MLISLICFQKLFSSALKTYTNILIDVYLIVSTIIHKTISIFLVFKYFRFEYGASSEAGLISAGCFFNTEDLINLNALETCQTISMETWRLTSYCIVLKQKSLLWSIRRSADLAWLVASAPFSARFRKSDLGGLFFHVNDFGWFDAIREGGQHGTVGSTESTQ